MINLLKNMHALYRAEIISGLVSTIFYGITLFGTGSFKSAALASGIAVVVAALFIPTCEALVAAISATAAVAIAIIPVMSSIWLCLIPTILFGIAHGLNLPGQQVISASLVPLEHRASFMSVQGTMVMVGITIGPPIMSLVFGLTGINIVFLVAAVISLIIPVMAVIIGRQKLPAF